jgi:hypothetical protein
MIEIAMQLQSAGDLFDRFDPAPAERRRLSADAVAYALSVLKSQKERGAIEIVLLLPESARAAETESALRNAIPTHFRRLIDVANKDIARIRLIGRVFVPIGLVIMCVCMLIENWLTEGNDRHLRHSIGEGILVLGWVALWAPFEHLLFGRLPVMRERSYYRQLAQASVQFRYTS